jgi:hypothetical protein
MFVEFTSRLGRFLALCLFAAVVSLISIAPALALNASPTDCIIPLPATPTAGGSFVVANPPAHGALSLAKQVNATVNFALSDGASDGTTDCDADANGIGPTENSTNPADSNLPPLSFTTSASTTGATYMVTALSCDASVAAPLCLTDMSGNPNCNDTVCNDGAFAWSIAVVSTTPAFNSATSDTVAVWFDPSGAVNGDGSPVFNEPLNIQITLQTPPLLATQAIASKILTEGQTVTPFTPVTGSGGVAPLSFNISPTLPSGLSLDSTTGAISGSPSVTLTANRFTVTVTGADSSTATANFSLTVNSAVLATQATGTVALTQNHAASLTPVTGSGGTGSLSFGISPALPAGLMFSTATGAITGTPMATLTATTFSVTVTDTNLATASNTFSLTVNTAVAASVSITSAVFTATEASVSFKPISGAGGTGTLTYSVVPALPAGLSLSAGTGTITGSPTATHAASTFTITVTDVNLATAGNTFSLTVNSVTTASQAVASKALTRNEATPYTPVTATGGTAPLVFSVSPTLPAGLSISSSTGAISGVPTLTTGATTFTVLVTDASGVSGSAGFSLSVNGAVVANQSVASTTLTQSHAASFTPVTGSGGTGSLIFGVVPSLPAGLTLSSSTGAISGTPTATLTATSFTMTVTDTNSATATQTFSLAVNGAVTATQSVATTALTESHVATAFTPVTGGGGTGSLAFSLSPTSPAGLNFSASTGTITGTPTATLAATTFTVTVTDTNAATATATFSLTISGPLAASQAIASTVLTQNHAGASFTPVTASGGTGPLSLSVSPILPSGLTLSSSSGAITGTPTVALMATIFTVTATDANMATSTSTFSLTVNGAVVATPAVAVTSLTQNHGASFTPVTGSGGTGSLIFGVSPSLPSGLTLSGSTGAITGTPSVASAASVFTVTVTDTNGAAATQTFSLAINGAVQAHQAVASSALTQNHAATAFTPVTGSGGTGSLSFSVSPGLPAGLAIAAATGAVTGTPTVALTATSFTVTVADSNGATATATFSLAVNGPLVASQAIATKGLTVNFAPAPFKPVNASGGTGSLTFAVAPPLPAGITMAPSTGIISGLPTVPTGAQTYTVTVMDANGATTTATFSLAVNGAVAAHQQVATTVLTQNHPSPAFTPVTGSGGTTPLGFSIAPPLPAGLTLAPTTGVISGTATVASAATSYTATVTDANGSTATATFTLTVNGAVAATQAIPSTSLAVNRVAAPFVPVTGAGGTGALTFAVAPALPAGLSLASATGTISGTPTGPLAISPFTVTVTDANGATASATFMLGVTTLTSATVVTSSLNPAAFGQTVTFKAVVSSTGGAPSGVVTFKDGATTLFVGTLAGRTTSFTTTTLSVGVHPITVAYNGDNDFAGSTSALTQTIAEPAGATAGQVYAYQSTLGTPGVAKADNAHFSNPIAGAVDPVHGHLFIADTQNQRVQILDTATFALIGTIGVPGAAGADNAHFTLPEGVGFDAANGHVLVADAGNDRIQVYDATSFAYVATLGSPGSAGTDNVHFDLPASVHVNAATHQLYVADTANHRIQIFDAGTFAYVTTLGVPGVAGNDENHFDQPRDAEVNPSSNQIMVADSLNGRIQLFDAATFAYAATIGSPTLNPADNDFFSLPVTTAFDPTTNLVLIADAGLDDRVQAFDAMTYGYVLTLGATASSGSANGQFAGPSGVAVDPTHSRIFVGDQQNDRVQTFSIEAPVSFASILPGSRSVQLGHAATVFASMINAGTSSLDDCRIALPVTSPAGLTLTYQTTDPATNALTGTPDTPASIAPGNGLQTFLIALTGTEPFSAPGMPIDFDCSGVGPASVTIGVDTIDLVMSTTPIADIVALSATPTNNGIAEVPNGGAGAFAVASTNVGIASEIVVSVDTGAAVLPLTVTICQSNPKTGQCLAPPAPSVTVPSFAAGADPTFSVFLEATGAIPFDPGQSRVFVRFKDSVGGLHGSTSVAVETE